ncbi:MAG TPA: hypothetical protein VLI94_05160 [Solirubrobacterales bacterium]|nr:hypothetical protein [Solirubrobacterales bacterium]
MQDKPSGAGNERATITAQEDHRSQAAVLKSILDLHPEPLTLAELTREMTIDSTDHGERDRIERAVRDLIGVGVLHLVGDLVLPTRAAVICGSLYDA